MADIKITFDAWKITKIFLDRWKIWINKVLWKAKDIAETISPTDTWDYIRSHKIQPAREEWNLVVWRLTNDSEHAYWVEYWFRKDPVNRHKWPPRKASTVIYNWVGARVYTRTVTNNQKSFMDIIIKELW